MSDQNPIEDKDIKNNRVEPQIETDKFSAEEQLRIVSMVIDDAERDRKELDAWKKQLALNYKMYTSEPPSKVEGLAKRSWMADRNIGFNASVCDSLIPTLSATCWNPNSLHFIASGKNDKDYSNNLSRAAKAIVEDKRLSMTKNVFDFIHNCVVCGFSVFKVYWKVYYETVDRQIPDESGKMKVKTETMRREYGVLENIADVEDILTPAYGISLQEVAHVIHVIHKYGYEIKDLIKRGVFVKSEGFEKKAEADQGMVVDGTKEQKLKTLHESITDDDVDFLYKPQDILEWYGKFEKNGTLEEYVFCVHEATRTFLSGKPLRKINRSNKRPFVSTPFIQYPGKLRGRGMPEHVAQICNGINTIFNQMTDYQTVVNCPFGFYNKNAESIKGTYDIEPGKLIPVEAPNEIVFPTIQRSMAWGENMIRLLIESLERMTGSASYFLTTQSNDTTATRDNLVESKSETRFSLWVKTLQESICEAQALLMSYYQQWSPPDFFENLLEGDGKSLHRNLTIDQLQGQYDAQMSPDIVAGSKAFEAMLAMKRYETFSTNPMFNPQVNAQGFYRLTKDAMRGAGADNPELYMPPEPKAINGVSDSIKDEFYRLKQGERIDPPEGSTAEAMNHLEGHLKQYTESMHDIPAEYRGFFNEHIQKTMINVALYQKEMFAEMMSTQMAIQNLMHRGYNGQGTPKGTSEQSAMGLGSGGAGGTQGQVGSADISGGQMPRQQGLDGTGGEVEGSGIANAMELRN
jgi:hypothetical protein